MRLAALCAALIALAACEPSGPSPRPEPTAAPKTGISISGSARVGVKTTR